MAKKNEKINATVNHKNGVTYYTFPLLEQYCVKHAFSTRLGGVSEGACAAMNLSFQRGDDREAVMENHRRFAEAVGYDERSLVFSDQIHETEIRVVDASDCGKGIFRESDLRGVDGLLTSDPGVVLMTFFADCVPLFFYDPIKRVVGAVHSGWRGTVKRIGAKAVEVMRREFGTNEKDLAAVIGPSICRDCYEVSEDVALEFQREFTEEQWESMHNQGPDQAGEDKFRLDLWRANEIILREAGIPEERIQVSGLCTCCNPELLFSHRATGGERGNLAGVIALGR